MSAYYDSCPECDSLNTEAMEDDDPSFLVAVCHDCGASWRDFNDEEE